MVMREKVKSGRSFDVGVGNVKVNGILDWRGPPKEKRFVIDIDMVEGRGSGGSKARRVGGAGIAVVGRSTRSVAMAAVGGVGVDGGGEAIS